jgi:phosphoribosylformylglycinamidine synthase
LLVEVIGRGLVRSSHDVADGGLAVALAESAILGDVGASLDPGVDEHELFGEGQSRAVVSAEPKDVAEIQRLAASAGVSCTRLGIVGGRRLTWRGAFDLSIEEVAFAWRHGLEGS